MSDHPSAETVLSAFIALIDERTGRGDALVIEGPPGSGRTHLCDALARMGQVQGRPVHCLRLQSATGRRALVKALGHLAGTEAMVPNDCAAALTILAGPARGALLLIDDADNLSCFALRQLIEARHSIESRIDLVLLAGEGTVSQWQEVPSLRLATFVVAPLPRLGPDEARDLVLATAGETGLDERLLRRILARGHGLPGRLQVLTHETRLASRRGRPAQSVISSRAIASVLVVGLVVLAGWWWTRAGHGPDGTIVEVVRTVQPGPIEDEGGTVITTSSAPPSLVSAPVEADPSHPEVVVKRATDQGRDEAGPVSPDDPADTGSDAAAGPGVGSRGEVDASRSSAESARPAAIVTQAVPENAATGGGRAVAVSESSTTHIVDAIHDGVWFAATRKDASYAIQLVSFKTRADAERYIRRNHIEAEAAYLETRHRGLPLFLVVYGEYPGVAAGNAAVAALPATLRRYRPWVRRISTLKRLQTR